MTKQEEIKEMATTMCGFYNNGKCAFREDNPCNKFNSQECSYKEDAEELYYAGYRKVLLNTEDGKAVDCVQYAPWQLIEGYTEREVEKVRKETAREILDMLYVMGIDKEILECCRIYDVNGVPFAKQICEKYGVEIEKCQR